MSLKRVIFIIITCLVLVLIIQGIGVTSAYFSDSEVSVNNTLRFKESW